MSKVEQLGRMKQGDRKVEDLFSYKHDTIIILDTNSGKGVIEETALFPELKKHPILQNFSLPIKKGSAFVARYMRITHNIVFNDPSQKWVFEQFSYISVKIDSVSYSDIPLSHLLPYNRVRSGGYTVDTAATPITVKYYDQATAKDGGFVKLASPITFPEQGNVELNFVPGGKGIATDTVATYGTKFGAGVVAASDPACYFVKVEILGTEVRERSR